MKKQLFALLGVTVLCTASAFAQSNEVIAPILGAALVGSLTVSIDSVYLDQGLIRFKKVTSDPAFANEGGSASGQIFIFRTSTGQIQYSIDVSTIKLDNNPLLDRLTATDIRAMVAEATVKAGVEEGYTTPTMYGSTETAVYVPLQVARLGIGTGTEIVSPNENDLAKQNYQVDWQTTQPTVKATSFQDVPDNMAAVD